MQRLLVMIMAGGVGERLLPLTRERAKSAVPFGGKYRLIDLALSNCVNSGVRCILVLTQYRSGSLHMHIEEGWAISHSHLGDYIYCVPPQQKLGADGYGGTADAVRQNLDLIARRDASAVLILSGDHVYKMNYQQMLSYHNSHRSQLTVAAVRVKKSEAAHRLGVLEMGDDKRLVGFEEKPAEPKTMASAPDFCLASMGIYLFDAEYLKEALASEGDDFGKQIIPQLLQTEHRIFVYDYETQNRIEDFTVRVRGRKRKRVLVPRTPDSTYWRDVGTIDSYYEASMDLLGEDPLFNMYGQNWPFRTNERPLPPSKCMLGGSVQDSMMCDGCVINGGHVSDSILSPGVVIEKGALVEHSIVLDDVVVEPGAMIKRAIIDKDCNIQSGATLGYDLEADKKRGCTVSASGIVVVPKGLIIGRA